MTTEIYETMENEQYELTKEEEQKIVKHISKNYENYNENRRNNLLKSEKVIDEIFFKKETSSNNKKENWKSKIRMCKTYMFYQTLKAFIWKNIYSNFNSMFDVSGENFDSDSNSSKQKAVLVDMLEKMDFQKTCDEVIDNALLYGELISYTAWKKKTSEYRRPIGFFRNLFSTDFKKLPLILNAIKKGKNFWIDTKETYNNPYIYPVNPSDLVFDITQSDDWESCPKIYRTFKTPDSIINNKFYTIDEETIQNIKNLISENNSDIKSQDKKNLKNEIINGRTVEVLEHYGDYKLSDGTILKNWHIAIVARKYLILFKKNESVINPFSYGVFIKDPVTKRGISPLYCILSLAHSQENLINRTINLQSLSENPPLIAPEGFFDEEEVSLYPGKIIEYDDNLTASDVFKQMSFNNTVFLNDINFLNDLMCEVSGIYPSMIGTDERYSKTATEINTKTQGQLTRLSMLLDVINQDFIIPCIKNIAELSANFKMGEERIFLNQNDNPEEIIIDDIVRQADYKYIYSDRNVLNEKYQNADLMITATEKFAQLIPLNIQEIFTWYFEQKGVENPERFLAEQNNNIDIENVVALKSLLDQQQNKNNNQDEQPQETKQDDNENK